MSVQADTFDALGGALLLPRDREPWHVSWVPETQLARKVKVASKKAAALGRTKGLAESAAQSPEQRQVRAITEREAEWVRAANRGSMAAFELIVRRYQRPVMSLIVRKVRDPGLAEDLAQETFIKAFRALDTFDPSRRLASWLFKIANNTAIDHLRRKRLPTQALERSGADERSLIDTLPDDECLAADRKVEGTQLGQKLHRAMEKLRVDYREVLTLRFVEGLSYLEVAEVTGQPLGTIKTKIHRGRRDLAALLS